MATIADLAIAVTLDDKGVEKGASSVADKVGKLGSTLTKTLTPAAAGIALIGKKAFDDWHGGLTAIRAGTGATGSDLKALEGVMKNVGANSTSSLSDIGQTVADLNTALGITGKPLEVLTKKFTDLDRLGMPTSVSSITRAFGDWGVKTAEQADTMDLLFRASQATGPSIDRLADLIVKFGAPMRQFGFSMEEAAVLLGRFEKEGVNTELVMGSMRIAMGKFAKAGVPMRKGLDDVIARITKLGPGADATALAMKTFGARAGPDMAAAILEGKFSIDELLTSVRNSSDTIDKAAADTLTLGDRMTMLKNRAVGAIGPYGEMIAVVGTGAAAVGPALMGFNQMAKILPVLGNVTKAYAAVQWLLNAALTANPIGLIIVALVALGAALVVAYKKSETFRKIVQAALEFVEKAFDAVMKVVEKFADVFIDAINDPIGFLKRNWPEIATILAGPFAPLVILATDAFGIRSALTNAIGGLLSWARSNWPEIATIMSGPFAPIVALATNAFGVRDAFTGALTGIKSWVTSNWPEIATLLSGPFAPIVALATNSFGIRKAFVEALGGLKKAVVEKITEVVTGITELGERFLTAGKTLGTKILNGALNGLKGIAGDVKGKVRDAIVAVGDLAEAAFNTAAKIGGKLVSGALAGLKTIGSEIKGAVRDGIVAVGDLVQVAINWGTKVGAALARAVVDGIGNLAGDVAAKVRDAVNHVISRVNYVIGRINSALEIHFPGLSIAGVQVIPGASINPPDIPTIPSLDRGGITTRDTLAYLHRNEAVIPLGSRGLRGGGSTVVNVYATVNSDEQGVRELVQRISRELERSERRN